MLLQGGRSARIVVRPEDRPAAEYFNPVFQELTGSSLETVVLASLRRITVRCS